MNELTQKYIDSREVAEMVGKQHNDYLKISVDMLVS